MGKDKTPRGLSWGPHVPLKPSQICCWEQVSSLLSHGAICIDCSSSTQPSPTDTEFERWQTQPGSTRARQEIPQAQPMVALGELFHLPIAVASSELGMRNIPLLRGAVEGWVVVSLQGWVVTVFTGVPG